VAEIGAGLCCADLGLPNVLHDSHASYVGHWLGILRGDKTAIIHAAAKAEQAFTYLKSFGVDANLPGPMPGATTAPSEPAIAA
ncbi:zincin-like metallopeptidase domain-containing protein, partial [Sphingobium chungbukense]